MPRSALACVRRTAGQVLGMFGRLWRDANGAINAEYIVLVTVVAIGAVIALAVLREALVEELRELAGSIPQIFIP